MSSIERIALTIIMALQGVPAEASQSLDELITKDYDTNLETLFQYFHQNPELSLQEHHTSKRLATELRKAGYEVTEGIAKTGVVAILKNGKGPLVMMRADMDGLPIQERTGLSYISKQQQLDPDGVMRPVMHACGHDVHITSLVGTARYMASHRSEWSGTLMLVGQPAEERFGGARLMREAKLYEQFGTPKFALAFHVNAQMEAGKIYASETSAYAGVDTVDIIVHGIGAHGAAPHAGRDPIVISAHIITALQTLISRTLSPRIPGVITVGSIHAGSKHNIIPEKAKMQLTVRSDDSETRKTLLDGIRRITLHTARALGVPENKLPEVHRLTSDTYPPTRNAPALVRQLKRAWKKHLGQDIFANYRSLTMGAEDFPFFTTDLKTQAPIIPSVYFGVGGTPANELERAAPHHSPLFKITPRPSIVTGVKATVIALNELMPITN